MSVEEAEEVVERLGEGGMLSLEEGVIDGTTVEGRERLKALEKEAERGRVEEVEEGDQPLEERSEEIEVADPD
jgi:cell division cycle protein 37